MLWIPTFQTPFLVIFHVFSFIWFTTTHSPYSYVFFYSRVFYSCVLNRPSYNVQAYIVKPPCRSPGPSLLPEVWTLHCITFRVRETVGVPWLLSSVYFSLEPAGPLLFGRSDETPALVFEKDTRILRRLCHDYEAVVVVCMNIFCTKRQVMKAEPFCFLPFFLIKRTLHLCHFQGFVRFVPKAAIRCWQQFRTQLK